MHNEQIIDRILEREGSTFTDRPSDRGGPTKFGITQKAWAAYAPRVTPAGAQPVTVASINEADAREFYRVQYITPLAWITNDDLRELMIDSAVNHGAFRAVQWLQFAAGVTPDGLIGEDTRHAVASSSDSLADAQWQKHLYTVMLIRRFKFYAEIASDQLPADPDLPNLRGWIDRACGFIR